MCFSYICPKSTKALVEEDAFLPVTVKNVSEMRRLMPQFMLEVKAMARPLIPPGKISLSTSQGTGGKGRGGGDSRIIKKPLTPRGRPWISALVLPDLWLESRAMCLLLPSSQVRKGSKEL